VPAIELGSRSQDQQPAELKLLAADLGAEGRIDLASLRVVRYDPATEKEVSTPLPWRWYDDAIPYDFPECEQNAHATDGPSLRFVSHPRWGDFYNLLGDGASGRLVWTHTQQGRAAAVYRISASLLPKGQSPDRLPPRGFVGDGSHRCSETAASTTGMYLGRLAVVDWDADGLLDLLIGGSRGQVLFYPNRGTRQRPEFPYARLVFTADGKPLDVGFSSSPLTVDWDGDGLTDIISGTERNRALFFRNTGTARAPRLVNQGFLLADGQPLALPVEPVPKSPKGVYELDYFPTMEAADWNGDGRTDLLCGGYITGRIYLFENIGRGTAGAPRLKLIGPLEADGKPLNVGDWAAAPAVADLDGDGDLDLMSGNMPLNAGGGDSTDPDRVLRYYENVGTPRAPRLAERAFPKTGKFPYVSLAAPRAVDLNGDGLLDLAVSAGENVFIWYNVGTRHEPKFAVHDKPLKGHWGSDPLPIFGLQFLGADADKGTTFFSGFTLYRDAGGGRFQGEALLPSGNRIHHPWRSGDGWTFTQLADLDGDGRRDLLYGTHEGTVWLHANLGGTPERYDERGQLLGLVNGKTLEVGPAAGQKMDFDVLQGARTTLSAADFDRDDRIDLVVGDTYGKVRHFRNVGTRQKPIFAAPVEIGDMKTRMTPYAADWDGDGRTDVVGSAAAGEVAFFRNRGDGRFAPSAPIQVPALPYGPFAAVSDWNRDGDADLIVGTGYGYFCWFERSFLERGYATATRFGVSE
jgi:hypothetical protein